MPVPNSSLGGRSSKMRRPSKLEKERMQQLFKRNMSFWRTARFRLNSHSCRILKMSFPPVKHCHLRNYLSMSQLLAEDTSAWNSESPSECSAQKSPSLKQWTASYQFSTKNCDGHWKWPSRSKKSRPISASLPRALNQQKTDVANSILSTRTRKMRRKCRMLSSTKFSSL